MDVSDDDVGSDRSASAGPRDGGGRRSEFAGDGAGDGGQGDPADGPGAGGRSDLDRGDSEWLTFAADVAASVLAVLLVGFFLFAVSGVWPPMVAIESDSMHPNMQTGDLVFVTDAERFPGEGAHADTGVVTAASGDETNYHRFGRPGDVIVFAPDGSGDRTPIIHRAVLRVEDGENWYSRADRAAIRGADDCAELRNCPAPHAGFVTKGDNNPAYDQVTGLSEPVRPEWVLGTAEARVPRAGCLRLPNEPCLGGVGADAGAASASITAGGTAPTAEGSNPD